MGFFRAWGLPSSFSGLFSCLLIFVRGADLAEA